MVECKNCGKSNSLDSRYCRECGAALAGDALAEAQGANIHLLSEGRRLLAEGRFDEAMMVGQQALEADPISVAAWSLLGDCHEHGGAIDEALLCYEKVAELHPDSTLDRIKVTHLRKMLATSNLVEPSDRKRAIFAAAAAVVLVACLGTAMAMLGPGASRSPAVAANLPGKEIQPLVSAANPPAPNATQQNPTSSSGPNTADPKAGDTAKPSTVVRAPPMDGSHKETLPFPLGDGGLKPLNPNPSGVEIVPDGKESTKGSSTESADPNPKPDPDKAAAPAGPPAIIEIKPSQTNRTERGGSEVIETGRSETLVQVARNRYLTGDYQGASDAYEKALRSGYESGSTNQHLAQCYEKLGRPKDAVACYYRAIRAFDASLANGTGDSGRLKRASESCKQAIKVLEAR